MNKIQRVRCRIDAPLLQTEMIITVRDQLLRINRASSLVFTAALSSYKDSCIISFVALGQFGKRGLQHPLNNCGLSLEAWRLKDVVVYKTARV